MFFFAEWQKLKQALGSTKHASLGIDESLSQTAFDIKHWLNDSFVDVITIKPMFLGGLIPLPCWRLKLKSKDSSLYYS